MGISKAMASELITDPNQQGVAMSVISTVWGLGMIIGPGMLS